MTGKRIKKVAKLQAPLVPTAPQTFIKKCKICGKEKKYSTSFDEAKRKKQMEKTEMTCRKCRKHSSIKKRRTIALDKIEQSPKNIRSLSPSEFAQKQGLNLQR